MQAIRSTTEATTSLDGPPRQLVRVPRCSGERSRSSSGGRNVARPRTPPGPGMGGRAWRIRASSWRPRDLAAHAGEAFQRGVTRPRPACPRHRPTRSAVRARL